MDLLPSAEQEQIIDAVRRFLADNLPVSRLHREQRPWAATPAVWQDIAELGWFGLGLGEEHGGVGYSVVEEILLMIEAGRFVPPLGLLGGILGARIAAHSGQAAICEGILSGERRVGLAVPGSNAAITTDLIEGDFYIVDGEGATDIAFIGRTVAALVPADSLLLEISGCVDPSVSLGIATNLAIKPIVALEDATAIYALGQILSAAMLVGQAGAVLDMSVEYAKLREQFGKTLGKFQTISHRCADMAVRYEAAKAIVHYAGLLMADQAVDAAVQVASAKILSLEAAQINAADNVQIHGGIGFTDECDAHYFVKRAHILKQLFGSGKESRAAILAPAERAKTEAFKGPLLQYAYIG